MKSSAILVALFLVIAVATPVHAATVITTVDPGIGQVMVGSGLNRPLGLDFNAAGKLYIAVNSGVAEMTFDGMGNPLSLNASFGTTPGGVIGWLAVDSAGNILVTDARTVSSDKVYKVGSGGGAAAIFMSLNNPTEIAMTTAPSGNLYISKRMNGQVVEVDDISAAILKTIATGGLPTGLAFDTAGNLYVARRDNGAILKVTDPTGAATISTLATVPTSTTILGLTYDPVRGDMVGFNNNTGGIYRIDLTSGAVTPYATVSSGFGGQQMGDLTVAAGGDYLITIPGDPNTPRTGEVWRLSHPAMVPLPASALMGLGLLGVLGAIRRLRRRN